jgi:hypothetical protein
MGTSAFPIVAASSSQVKDRGLTAREVVASIVLSGMFGNSQEHVTDDQCRCHVTLAVKAADMLLETTRGG